MDSSRSVTCESPINIALVKYWGKDDTKQIIPANDSLSITVSKKALCSTTKITLLPIQDNQVTL